MKHTIEIERALIRCILDGKQCTLTTEQFFGTDNAVVYKTVLENDGLTDLLLLRNKLESDGNYDLIGGDTYFNLLETTPFKLDSFGDYAAEVRQAYFIRESEKLGREIERNPEKTVELYIEFEKQINSMLDNVWWTLADVLDFDTAIDYVVNEAFEFGSLNIVYGQSGGFKSFLITDLALCVAAGLPWLLPVEDYLRPFKTTQVPVLWVDADQGTRKVCERLQALVSAKEIVNARDLPFYVDPMNGLNAKNIEEVNTLINRAKRNNIGMIAIDNLGTISGGANENTHEMIPVVYNLRRLAEKTGATVIVLHHQRKGSNKDNRKGESLRGHTSIEAALDLALLLERDGDDDSGKVICTKHRGARVRRFGFIFEFLKEDGKMVWADFRQTKRDDVTTDDRVAELIVEQVKKAGPANQKNLIAWVQGKCEKVGKNRIRNILKQLVKDDKLSCKPAGAGYSYGATFGS